MPNLRYGFRDQTALHRAVESGELALLDLILDCALKKGKQLDANRVDCRGMTALHYAARSGHTGMAASLLSKSNALLKAVDEFQRTPHELAMRNRHWQTADFLRSESRM